MRGCEGARVRGCEGARVRAPSAQQQFSLTGREKARNRKTVEETPASEEHPLWAIPNL
ncbi:hypothetical protein [Kamptonema formosum]|uniref:hypothetical protein n=1 Tax=Kamptonema formosum TaxID=331992 RepID=UPI0012DBE3C3|nr:hypothetical protein [Oscillatoria sp. PCC 10802]